MKDKSGILGMMAFIAAMSAQSYSGEERTPNKEAVRRQPIKKVIPKGCKEYFFTQSGCIHVVKSANYNYVFECIASNEKAAEKKFDKFIKNQPPKTT